ncbi:NAD(P)H-hydrate dehydratase [Helcococcus kunzii]|uniref:Multifunctional fusion protein n=1 Tax=Helcococcus kunzii ATCC 51366 TaxID=883114 RepID=H3NLZ4_9FIRM|nr:NAD(P)H-hydrate dehydratase [Helcococcus kunzii]EHR35664.1 holo-[acyl-carrier-protein] synthase [Helcococcus kunzii ATCC 51366]QUY64314.1 NAD(P)H-hydrate dehydratase [Helcococcus kunzii]QZO76725.1 NAD(P)H-hydrate dehydratase [Helcococcus kunzii]
MIGIDIFKIDRVNKLKQKERFIKRFFTSNEIEYLKSRHLSSHSIAGLFATKEAVTKAFGVGISEELGLSDIEVLHDEKNAPYINTELNKIKILMEKKNIKNINVNISHDGDYAIAICKLSEEENKTGVDSMLPQRIDDSNKYTYGKILIIGGSKGMSGSVFLASEAALRAGAGIVYTLVPECLTEILENKTTEQIVISLNDDGDKEFGNFKREDLLNIIQNKSVIAIGPGMGHSEHVKEILEIVLYNFDGPIVIDADAIDIIADNHELIRENIYLTPHAMEFSRLSGYTLNEINYDREGFVHNFIDRYDVNLLLKGKNSIIANKEQFYINETGNNGMSTSGSGDVLTGIISAFLARENSFDMFKLACFVHGLSGDLAAKRYGKTSLIARDIINFLPYAIGELDGE